MSTLMSNGHFMIAALVLVMVALVVFVYLRLKASQRRLDQMQSELTNLHKQLTFFNEGAVGIGRRLVEAERQLQTLCEEQSELMRKDDELSYTKANELIDQGAGVEALMQECHLPQAEAELMLLIHRQLKAD